ncbi:MAG: DUF4377 domain-containing protein, partial [Candidatus Promineifilaceae bacterium]
MKRSRNLLLIPVLALALGLFTSCSFVEGLQSQTGGEEMTLYVGPELVDCVGAHPQTCMLVRESPDEEYQFFYGQIKGFDYEEGYEYELVVNVTDRENPPQDVSPQEYTLVEVVSKTPAEPEAQTMTLYVGPELVDCVGAHPQTCLLVRESPDEEYQFFYGQIEG